MCLSTQLVYLYGCSALPLPSTPRRIVPWSHKLPPTRKVSGDGYAPGGENSELEALVSACICMEDSEAHMSRSTRKLSFSTCDIHSSETKWVPLITLGHGLFPWHLWPHVFESCTNVDSTPTLLNIEVRAFAPQSTRNLSLTSIPVDRHPGEPAVTSAVTSALQLGIVIYLPSIGLHSWNDIGTSSQSAFPMRTSSMFSQIILVVSTRPCQTPCNYPRIDSGGCLSLRASFAPPYRRYSGTRFVASAVLRHENRVQTYICTFPLLT